MYIYFNSINVKKNKKYFIKNIIVFIIFFLKTKYSVFKKNSIKLCNFLKRRK